MLCGEIVVVYCENRTEHINALCGKCADYLLLSIVLGLHVLTSAF
jgi:hypothetical protein